MTTKELMVYEDKLLPCPFCGSKATIYKEITNLGLDAICIFCDNVHCCVRTKWFKQIAKKRAAEFWNSRPEEEKTDMEMKHE